MNVRTIGASFVLSLAACCLAGCGADPGPEIKGKVTLNGQPLAGAEVLFLPADKDPTKGAGLRTTADDGTFVFEPDEENCIGIALGRPDLPAFEGFAVHALAFPIAATIAAKVIPGFLPSHSQSVGPGSPGNSGSRHSLQKSGRVSGCIPRANRSS